MKQTIILLRGWLPLAGLTELALLLFVALLCALTGSWRVQAIGGLLALTGLGTLGLAIFAGVSGSTEMKCRGVHAMQVMTTSMGGADHRTVTNLTQLPTSALILSLGVFAAVVNIGLGIALHALLG